MLTHLKKHKIATALIICSLIVAFAGVTMVTSGYTVPHCKIIQVSGTFSTNGKDGSSYTLYYSNDYRPDYPYLVTAGVQDSTFHGSLRGTWVSHWTEYINATSSTYTAVSEAVFSGSLYDSKNTLVGTGTLTLRLTAFGDFSDANYIFHDTWIIIGGTGDLAKVTGSGIADFNLKNDFYNAYYSGFVFLGK